MNFIDKLILILIIVGSIVAILSYIGTKISFNEPSSSAEKRVRKRVGNMTKQEMLSEVEAKIRKDIPRLMELSEGCKLSFKDPYTPDLITIIDENNEEDIFYVIDEFYDVSEYKKDYVKGHYEILGHDITLNDVLEWLKYLGFLTECSNINFDGNTFCKSKLVYDNDDNFLYKKTTFCEWNLPSPYLKDQPEDLIKFLYNLKKE